MYLFSANRLNRFFEVSSKIKKLRQALVSSVAVGLIMRMLALAKIRGFLFFRFENQRRKFGSAMGSVAKGLRLRLAASAPGVSFARFEFNSNGGFGCHMRFGHGLSP
jgi:hypothetical protein